MVEGVDDEHVLKHVCGNRDLPEFEEIKNYGGVDPLLESLPVRLKACEDGDVVGVVIDADSDLNARWDSLRGQIIQAGYENVPVNPDSGGTILDPPPNTLLPRMGTWLMPDNQRTGILEDFLKFLVPEGTLLFEHVKVSVDGIPDGEWRFSQLAKPKALIHTWLAWQQEPGKPLGTAITARYLDPMVPQVDTLVGWLRRLFML